MAGIPFWAKLSAGILGNMIDTEYNTVQAFHIQLFYISCKTYNLFQKFLYCILKRDYVVGKLGVHQFTPLTFEMEKSIFLGQYKYCVDL